MKLWLQRLLCALHGHDAILQYEPGRIYLQCTSCGYQTPGWDLRSVDDARRAQLRQMLRRACEAR